MPKTNLKSKAVKLAAPKGAGFFAALPPNIKKIVEKQASAIAETQASDLSKVVLFNYNSSQTAGNDPEQIAQDIQDAADSVIDGATRSGMSVDAGAGNAVANVSNEARLEYFFEPEVLNEIESFTFINEDPVSTICQALNGTTWAPDDSDIDKYGPPLHHNCKSRLSPNLKGDPNNPEITGTPDLSDAELAAITLCETKLADDTAACVSDWIKKLIAEGKPQDQAIAIAYSKCGEKQMLEYFAELSKKYPNAAY